MLSSGEASPYPHVPADSGVPARARSTVVDSVVWLPYGDTLHVDPVRLRYMDMILGFAKCRLIAAIERFRVDKGGLPPHLEHVRAPARAPRLHGPAVPGVNAFCACNYEHSVLHSMSFVGLHRVAASTVARVPAGTHTPPMLHAASGFPSVVTPWAWKQSVVRCAWT